MKLSMVQFNIFRIEIKKNWIQKICLDGNLLLDM